MSQEGNERNEEHHHWRIFHPIKAVLDEIGLVTLFFSPINSKLLIFGRFVRLFAYGGSTLILASYLSELGASDTRIGLFMTLTLVGDIVISFILTLFADTMGRRFTMGIGAIMMTGSGVVFALSSNYWILLTAAILGVITPSGNEIGPFRAVEESTLAHLTPKTHRSDIFVWYSLIGTAGTALGFIGCGWIITTLQESNNYSPLQAYRIIYYGYAAVGILKLLLAVALTKACEMDEQSDSTNTNERAPLLGRNSTEPIKKKNKLNPLSNFTKESRLIMLQLFILFAFDNLASGLAPLSWVTYFFKMKFHLAEGKLGSIFSITGIISAFSMLIASSLAKRIGNVKTMVFTHLPSAICLALIPIPSTLPGALTFLVLRACTQVMDVAPRSAFLAAIVLPHEQTAFYGTLNVVKTCSQSLGPFITGILSTKRHFWVAFIIAGSLKATYDLGLLYSFAGRQSREEETQDSRQIQDSEHSDDS